MYKPVYILTRTATETETATETATATETVAATVSATKTATATKTETMAATATATATTETMAATATATATTETVAATGANVNVMILTTVTMAPRVFNDLGKRNDVVQKMKMANSAVEAEIAGLVGRDGVTVTHMFVNAD